jgi:hypothetical protein
MDDPDPRRQRYDSRTENATGLAVTGFRGRGEGYAGAVGAAEERLARNEAFFREVNERINDVVGVAGDVADGLAPG